MQCMEAYGSFYFPSEVFWNLSSGFCLCLGFKESAGLNFHRSNLYQSRQFSACRNHQPAGRRSHRCVPFHLGTKLARDDYIVWLYIYTKRD